MRKTLIGKTRRRDGRLQFTYNGWPLYYYAHDRPGEVRCQTWASTAASGSSCVRTGRSFDSELNGPSERLGFLEVG